MEKQSIKSAVLGLPNHVLLEAFEILNEGDLSSICIDLGYDEFTTEDAVVYMKKLITGQIVYRVSFDKWVACINYLQSNIEEESMSTTPLKTGRSYSLGNFHIIHNADSGDIRVLIHENKYKLAIKPNTDNSCTLVAFR